MAGNAEMKRGLSSGPRSASKVVYLSSSDEEDVQEKSTSNKAAAKPNKTEIAVVEAVSIDAVAPSSANTSVPQTSVPQTSGKRPSDTKSAVQKRRKLRNNIF